MNQGRNLKLCHQVLQSHTLIQSLWKKPVSFKTFSSKTNIIDFILLNLCTWGHMFLMFYVVKWEALVQHPEVQWLCPGKALVRLSWTTHFPFFSPHAVPLFTWQNNWQTMVIQTRDVADIISKMNPAYKTIYGIILNKPGNSRKMTYSINFSFWAKIGFWKTCICHSTFDSPPVLEDFSDEMGDSNEYDLWTWYNDILILYNEIRQHWEICITQPCWKILHE